MNFDLSLNSNEVELMLDVSVPQSVGLGKQFAVMSLLRKPESENLRQLVGSDVDRTEEDIWTSVGLDFSVCRKRGTLSGPDDLRVVIDAPGFAPSTKTRILNLSVTGSESLRVCFFSATTVGRTDVRVSPIFRGKTITTLEFECECIARRSAAPIQISHEKDN